MKTVESNTSIPEAIIENETYWKNQMQSQSNSQLSKAAYCRVNQINYYRFNYWERRFKKMNNHKKLIPIRIKPVINANNEKKNPLCSILMKNGIDLHIHTEEALILILDKMI